MRLTEDFGTAMARLRGGDEEALADLLAEFKDYLSRVANRYLGSRLGRRADIEQIVLSACYHLFLDLADTTGGRRLEVRDRRHLRNLLAFVTRQECWREVQHLHRAIRDIRREVVLPPSSSENDNPWEGFSHDPAPEESVDLADAIAELKSRFTARQGAVLEFALRGTPPEEIAARLGCTLRTVARVQHDLQIYLRLQQLPDPAPGELLYREWRTFKRELARLLRQGEKGRFALIKGDSVLSTWDSLRDALQAGHDRFENATFLVLEIQACNQSGHWRYSSAFASLVSDSLEPGGLHHANRSCRSASP